MRKVIKLFFSIVIIAFLFFLVGCELDLSGITINKGDNINDSDKDIIYYEITYVVNSDKFSKKTFKYENDSLVNFDDIITTVFNNVLPTKNGYEGYSGLWYTDSEYTELVSFPYSVTNNASLYLKWEKSTETIEYNVNYYVDDKAVYSEKVKENQQALGNYYPYKTGYKFSGWYLDKNLTKAYNFSSKVTSNINLYAKFTSNPCTVQFLDKDNNDILEIQIVNYNEPVKMPDVPKKDGYKFIGWYDYTEKEFDFSKGITTDTKIYAKFELLDIEYNVNFCDFDEDIYYYIQTVKENTCAIKPNDPEKVGYKFIGWYTSWDYTTEFDFTTKITSNTNIYAKFISLNQYQINLMDFGGYDEGAYVEFEMLDDTDLSNYSITYQLQNGTIKTLDSQLIRKNGSIIRADILGLAAGIYNITITENKTSTSTKIENIQVTSADRSGYAHFSSTVGVGAYNNDGTLKSNTTIVYVTDLNKNTVTATIGGKTYTGLANILKNQSNSSYPLLIRIVGRISASTWNTLTYSGSSLSSTSITGINGEVLEQTSLFESQILSKGYNTLNESYTTKLDGLTNKIIYDSAKKEFDSYFNMLDISSVSNVTIEGVGTDAEIFQWGFMWSKCKSIEIKNLQFSNYPEDACSFQCGGNSTVNTYGRYWIHNNTFNSGKNNWDVTYNQDKHYGDGATNFKYVYGVTCSYNKFNSCNKTCLIGDSDSDCTKNITFHHNYYYKVDSRLPLARQANIHLYNNYYYQCNTAQDIRANAFAFSENNYFEYCNNPQLVTTNSTYTSTVIKSYNDYFLNCGTSQATSVNSRTTSLSGNCNPDGKNDYTNFDTNSNLFYYDLYNKITNVSLLTDAQTAKNDCVNLSGTLIGNFVSAENNIDNNNNDLNNSENNNSISNLVTLTFNNFSTGYFTNKTTIDGITINPRSDKKISIKENYQTLEGVTITKALYLTGTGSFDELSATFTTTKKANITVYFKSAGSTERYLGLFTNSGQTVGATSSTGDIVPCKFYNCSANTYSIASMDSGIYIYYILIEYID